MSFFNFKKSFNVTNTYCSLAISDKIFLNVRFNLSKLFSIFISFSIIPKFFLVIIYPVYVSFCIFLFSFSISFIFILFFILKLIDFSRVKFLKNGDTIFFSIIGGIFIFIVELFVLYIENVSIFLF